MYILNNTLYCPDRFSCEDCRNCKETNWNIDGSCGLPVKFAPGEPDAFEYMPNYDAWIENYLI